MNEPRPVTAHPDGLVERYEQYLAACNARDWDGIGSFVADTVLVNGRVRSRGEYLADIAMTLADFPDYRWTLRRTVHDGDWLAVHLHDTGTRHDASREPAGEGTHVETDEFNMYRFSNGVIIELEGTADNARLGP